MTKSGITATIRDDLAIALKEEAKSKGINFSQLLEEYLDKATSISGGAGGALGTLPIGDIYSTNNIIIIYNNIIILLYKHYTQLLEMEEKKTENKLREIKKLKKEKEDVLLNSIVTVEERLSKEQKDMLLNMDFGKPNCFDLLYKLKQESGLSFGDMRKYVDLVKQKEVLNNAVQ
jgi:hypothetical protein